ncbi:RNA polymerase-binding protein RbpA [Kutzneria sp. 744]|uniref:RNA polymerase-binding protein RbpA n=1 Tax=Kutzneria sp. (strain 744) TaxID=345341 RepID=UPI00351095AE
MLIPVVNHCVSFSTGHEQATPSAPPCHLAHANPPRAKRCQTRPRHTVARWRRGCRPGKGDHEFTVPFSAEGDVETPRGWECRQHGVLGTPLNGYRGPEPDERNPPSMHRPMIQGCRSIAELATLLDFRPSGVADW